MRKAIESAIDEHAEVPKPPHELIGDVVFYRVEMTDGDHRVCRIPDPR